MESVSRFPANGLLVVRSELSTLVISMKRSNRWSTATVLDQQARLLASLNCIRENLLAFDNLDQLRCEDFVRPFLDVISSEDTDSTATSAALSALNKFLTYGLIDFRTKSVVENIANAVIHAKFVGADQASDGVALAGVVQVLRNLIYSNGCIHLDDDLICKSISIFIRICIETRHNEPLKKLTETSLKDVLHVQCARFNSYEQQVPATATKTETIRDLFRSLIALCNIKDKEKTEYMIHMGLSLLKVFFENSADVFAQYPSFLELIKDDLCKNLLALINHERLSIFALNLQLLYLIFEALRKHLKFQFESFVQKLVNLYESDMMALAAGTTPKFSSSHREIVLDVLVQIWRTRGLLTELYYNYDCDLHSANLFQNTFELFSKILVAGTAISNSTNSGTSVSCSLAMNGIGALIESIECHCSTKNHPESSLTRIASISKSCRQHADSTFIPDRSRIAYIRTIKKLLPEGVQLFNQKPTKGIKFLQENAYLKMDNDAEEIAHFLRETPGLDKKAIGDFISARENIQILQAYVKTFDFATLKIDESLRMYVETFRLPGESALIYSTLEQFAEHWHKCNGEPFANADAAFTLAYSIIMLNIDQHNLNVRKQQPPMSLAKFKNMLVDANGGHAFDNQMLDDIYQSIRTNEIIMPCERDGVIKENYLWKLLLKQTESSRGRYVFVKNGTFDYEMLSVVLTGYVDNLTVIFNQSIDLLICTNIIAQFERLARILSNYELYDELDRLVINVCNFFRAGPSANPVRNHYQYAMILGENEKLQMSLKAIFRLVQEHICFVRESWKHILDIVKLLFQLKLLPEALVESEDFIEPAAKKTLVTEDGVVVAAGATTSDSAVATAAASSKPELSFFNSFYLYMLSENVSKTPSAEEQRQIDEAKRLVETNVRFEQILNDTKFLQFDSLKWLVRLLVDLSSTSSLEINDNNQIEGDCEVKAFFLELLIKVLIQNRDRILPIWSSIHDHFCSIIVFNSKLNRFLFERSIIGLLKLAINLMRNEDMSTVVLQSLQILFLVKPSLLFENSRQISFGLYELLKTAAQNIHTNTDWSLVFMMLEMFGAGVQVCAAGSAGASSAATSADDDIETAVQSADEEPGMGMVTSAADNRPKNGWILVETPNEDSPKTPQSGLFLATNKTIVHHDPYSMSKCCECLIFLVRDVAHITPFNYPSCLECIRGFVEAAAFFSNRVYTVLQKQQNLHPSGDCSDLQYYEQISIQLLDLIFTLYTRTLQIYEWWEKESAEEIPKISYWNQGWSPLLQAICRLCCDFNNKIRLNAISFLQRTLLFQDMAAMKPAEWTECFQQILYPLLAKLIDLAHEIVEFRQLEESMSRAITLTSKIFLLNLSSLQQMPPDCFHAIWLALLDYMHKFMYVNDSAELLFEAVPECLKNMLLVMKAARLLDDQSDGSLWTITWTKIDQFIPHLKIEFADANRSQKKSDLMMTGTVAAETATEAVESENLQLPDVNAVVLSSSSSSPPLPESLEQSQTVQTEENVTANRLESAETCVTKVAETFSSSTNDAKPTQSRIIPDQLPIESV